MAYRVIVVGMGKRGLHHASAFAANPRFELAGICSRDPQRLAAAASKLEAPGTLKTSTDPLAPTWTSSRTIASIRALTG